MAKYICLPHTSFKSIEKSVFFWPQSVFRNLSAADLTLPSNVKESLGVKFSLKNFNSSDFSYLHIQFTLTISEKISARQATGPFLRYAAMNTIFEC